jgi:methionyl-tRNA formyltransferase
VRIAFVGLPLAALLLLKDGHEIVWAGVCRKDALGIRRLIRTLGKSKVAIVPDLTQAKHVTALKDAKPDLLVSWFWTKKIPRAVLKIANQGALGVHPSLLPRHRGPDPTFWAIDCGDEETGVTAHVLEEEYDTGALLGQKQIAINKDWSAWRLAKKLDRPSLALLREVVRAYADGNPPKPMQQDDSRATDAPAPDDDLLEIRWQEMSAEAIERRVRAASPWPGAFTELTGGILTMTRVRITADIPTALEPGEIYVRKDGIAVVKTMDKKGIELHRARVDDDEERELDESEIAELIEASLY